MAPEQARGGDVDVDEPQLHGRVPRLRRARARLPVELSTLHDACLEPEPPARPELDEILQRPYALT